MRFRWHGHATPALVLAGLACAGSISWAQQPPDAAASRVTATAAGDRRNGFAEVLKPTKAQRSDTWTMIKNQPYAPIHKPQDEGQIPEIEMFVGESRVFPAPGVARIAVGNGALLTAAALDNKEIILFANGAGTSSLFIWNADGRYQRVKISIVPGDTTRHAREIAAFLSTIPKAKASVVGANIVVEGDELSDTDINKIEELAKRYPQILNFTNRVGWEQMVMLDVKVVEFPVTVLRDIGFRWSPTGGAAIAGIWSPARRGSNGPYEVAIRTGQENAVPITGPGGTPATIPSGLNAIAFLNLGLNAQLNLLAQEGKASVLAQPQLSARNGSRASFLAGGEIPYAVSNRDGVQVQFKTYGVKLEITPRVDQKGVIRATIQTEVSGIDRSVTTAGGPALLSRKTDTEFNLRDGETIVLSGLLQRETSTDVDKVPLIGDIPVLGALFRSKRFQNKETELVVFVTPMVVSANSPGTTDRVKRATDRLEQQMGANPYLPEPPRKGVGVEGPGAAVPAQLPIGDAVATQAAPLGQASMPEAMIAPVAPGAVGGSVLSVIADGTALREAPSSSSAMLMQLDAGATVLLGRADPQPPGSGLWRNVVVGALDGWVPATAVQPRSRAGDRTASPGVARQARSGALLPRSIASAAGGLASPHALTLVEPALPTLKRYIVTLDGLALRTLPDLNGDVVVNLIAGDTVTAMAQPARGAWTAVRFGDGQHAKRGWVATQWLVPLAGH